MTNLLKIVITLITLTLIACGQAVGTCETSADCFSGEYCSAAQVCYPNIEETDTDVEADAGDDVDVEADTEEPDADVPDTDTDVDPIPDVEEPDTDVEEPDVEEDADTETDTDVEEPDTDVEVLCTFEGEEVDCEVEFASYTYYGDWSECGGFESACDETGVQTREVSEVFVTCYGHEDCSEREAVSSEERVCNRDTEGDEYATQEETETVTETQCSYLDECEAEGTKEVTTQTVTTFYICSNGAEEEVVETEVNTVTEPCDRSLEEGPWNHGVWQGDAIMQQWRDNLHTMPEDDNPLTYCKVEGLLALGGYTLAQIPNSNLRIVEGQLDMTLNQPNTPHTVRDFSQFSELRKVDSLYIVGMGDGYSEIDGFTGFQNLEEVTGLLHLFNIKWGQHYSVLNWGFPSLITLGSVSVVQVANYQISTSCSAFAEALGTSNVLSCE